MSVSAHGDRKHWSSITTARRKKHLSHLTKRVRAPFDTTCCARAIGCAKRRQFFGAACARHRAAFSKTHETPIPQGLLQRHQLHRSMAPGCCDTRRQHPGCFTEALEAPAIACEKKLGNVRARAPSIDRIRRESRESLASDSRQASLAVTFWRRRGGLTAIFFRALDGRRPSKWEPVAKAAREFPLSRLRRRRACVRFRACA
jgi:hypothetical protein